MNFKNLRSFFGLFVVAVAMLGLASCSDDNSNNPNTNGSAQVTSFKFEGISPVAVGVIDQTAKTIKVTVPSTTDVTYLAPTIVVSSGASVDPQSGVFMDFTNPVQYTVTSSDNKTAVYTVTVTKQASTWEEISKNIDQNKVLVDRGPGIDYIVNKEITIEASALLTIEAGVEISFTEVGAGFNIGKNAGLKISGTAAKPVKFTGAVNNQNKGAWSGIYLQSARQDNVWEYVTIENAGDANGEALRLVGAAQLTLRNSTIRGSRNQGIRMDNGSLFNEFKNNTITNNDGYPVSADNYTQINTFDMTSSFSGNAQGADFIEIRGMEEFEKNFTIKKINVPYISDVILVSSGVLTIEPGVTLLFKSGGYYLQTRNTGVLKAEGTATDKIRFASEAGMEGTWEGLFLETKLSNTVKNAIIEFGGYNEQYANLSVRNGKVTLENVRIANSLNYGVIYNDNSTITHSGVTFENNSKGNVFNDSNDEVTETLP
ncbi:MAG: right-handed parallel beta-helix repeat-containing protein [Chloroflexota bacterium]